MELTRYTLVMEHPTMSYTTRNFKARDIDHAIGVARQFASGADWARLYSSESDEEAVWSKYYTTEEA